MVPEIDLLAIQHGSVAAPAGCGKTHVIAASLACHVATRPVLVLTHTNAGVMALRTRLTRAGVRPSAFRLATLDGWAMKLIAMFPKRSGHDPGILQLRRPSSDYPAIRRAAAQLMQSGQISDVLAASYDRLLVDEYQDCLELQHAIVGMAAQVLPTCVVGDPLQAIFGFAGKLVHWRDQVQAVFPRAGTLSTPWRWINAGEAEFGQWLLAARTKLLAGQPVDLRGAPDNVHWVPLDGTDDQSRKLSACRTKPISADGGVLIIAGSKDKSGQRRFAGKTPGAVTVESVDLADLVSLARTLDLEDPDALDRIAAFADDMMVDAAADDMVARVRRHDAHTQMATVSDAVQAGLAFASRPSYQAAVNLLIELNKQGGVRVHRPAVLSSCLTALSASDSAVPGSFLEAAMRAREEHRSRGRPLPNRAVGSTLLLKGLEADTVVVLDPTEMDAAHLYVAITRGSRKLVVCSPSPVLSPAR